MAFKTFALAPKLREIIVQQCLSPNLRRDVRNRHDQEGRNPMSTLEDAHTSKLSGVLRRSLAVGVAVLALAGALPAQAQEKVEFVLSWLPTGDYAYYSAGVLKGFYKEQGIDLTVRRGFGSIDSVSKVAAGTFPIAEADISAVMAGRVRQNTPVKCVLNTQTLSPHSLIVMADSGINSIKDLPGKTIGTQPGNSISLYFPIVARMNQIDATTVKSTNVDAATMVNLLIAGRVDAITLFGTGIAGVNRQAAQVGKQAKVLRYADFGLQMYSLCVIASEETIAKSPDLLRRFNRATLKSRDWARANLEETAALHTQMWPEVNRADAQAALTASFDFVFNEATTKDGSGKFNMDRLKTTWDVVAESLTLDRSYDYRQFVTDAAMP
jgi:NitT/TauT family transport system substrate-binding protein